MSEYWKSLPRKFCDICKCWFADNKASIEFHERGKRHQENAQKRIQDIQKRGIKDFKKQQQLEDDMAKIERAALAAYKKDLENNVEAVPSNPGVCAALLSNALPTVSVPKHSKNQKSKKHKGEVKGHKPPVKIEKEDPPITKRWYEALSEEGFKYYYHSETSETMWEPPKEGFISLEDQESFTSETNSTSETHKDNSSEEDEATKTCKVEPVSSVGPQPKIDPYGQWTTIEEKKYKPVDLQLPKASEDLVEVFIPVAKEEKLSIKEKVIGSLADTDPSEKVVFKKRKFGSLKRNVRQKIDEDD